MSRPVSVCETPATASTAVATALSATVVCHHHPHHHHHDLHSRGYNAHHLPAGTTSATNTTTHHHLTDHSHCAAASSGGWECSCSCDLPLLLGMGIKQSKFRERQQESLNNREGANRRGADNNHHNHHHGGPGAAPPPISQPGPLLGLGAPSLLQAELAPDCLRISKFKIGIDKRLTTIDERSPGVLKYKTPHFRAYSTVEIPALGDGTGIQIGWIQTCAHMQFLNTYGDYGVTSWEFPEILLGKFTMVSDADGKQYPWYGARQEVATVQGPCPRQQVTIEMNDNFFPQVTWCIPVENIDRKPRLTQIYRSQKFFTFLAMKNLATQEVHILRAVTWSMDLTIGVNPDRPLGQRAWLVGPEEQSPPRLVEANIPIPQYALQPPNANRSQTLIWRPRRGEPKLVVPPLESTIDIAKYITATRGMGRKLQALRPES